MDRETSPQDTRLSDGQNDKSECQCYPYCLHEGSPQQDWTDSELLGSSNRRQQSNAPSLTSLGFPPPHPGQQVVEANLARFNVINCGRRWGKTEYAMRKLAELALAGFPVAYLSPTYDMCEDVFAQLDERLAPVRARKADNKWIRLTTGGFIRLWSMDRGAERVRGRKYKRVVLDEAAIVADLSTLWQRVVRPTLADYQGDAFFVSTPRRGSGFENLYQSGEDESREHWRSWTMTTYSNPVISQEEIDEMAEDMTDQNFRQEIMAEFEASESDLVYPEFSRLVHVKNETTGWADCTTRVVGIDPGGGDPTAIVPLGVDALGHIHQYGEFYRRGDVSLEHIGEYLAKLGQIHAIAVGETGGNILVNSLRSIGFKQAFKADMERKQGIDLVKMLLDRRRLTVSPTCSNTITEYGLFRWAQKRDVTTGDRYATSMTGDRHGDAMDATRYGCITILRSLGRERRDVKVKYA